MDAAVHLNPEIPYNPLDKNNLGVSVTDALLAKPVVPLPPKNSFLGEGIYAIYYLGQFPQYSTIAARNSDDKFMQPIYVGKAIPKGGRKGGSSADTGPFLFKRLSEHAASIESAANLQIGDFRCRYLVVDDIWIPLAESLMIQNFQPIWNGVIDGFGNHDPGRGRHQGQIPPWDVLHPGRSWAAKLERNKKSKEDILMELEKFFTKGESETPLHGDGESE